MAAAARDGGVSHVDPWEPANANVMRCTVEHTDVAPAGETRRRRHTAEKERDERERETETESDGMTARLSRVMCRVELHSLTESEIRP